MLMSLADILQGDSFCTSRRSGKLHYSSSGLVGDYPVRLAVPFPLIVLTLPLWLTHLLAFILITTLVILFLHVVKHAVPHFLELVQSMLSPIGTFYTICSCSR